MMHPPPKKKSPVARGNARQGHPKQSNGPRCFSDNPRNRSSAQACLADFSTTPLSRAAEARERDSDWTAAPHHVKRIAGRHGLSLSLAATVAGLAGIGPVEAHHG